MHVVLMHVLHDVKPSKKDQSKMFAVTGAYNLLQEHAATIV